MTLIATALLGQRGIRTQLSPQRHCIGSGNDLPHVPSPLKGADESFLTL